LAVVVTNETLQITAIFSTENLVKPPPLVDIPQPHGSKAQQKTE